MYPFQMLIRTIYLLLILSTTSISSNRFYEKFRQLKSKAKEKLQEKSQCPLAWQYFAKSCYWKFPIRRSWSEGRKECERFGADLVVIDNDNEFDYIARNITDLREDFYVGFHFTNDSWSWINGRALSDYTYYSEADLCEDRLPIEPRHRTCGILDRARRGRLCMNADVCDRKLNFICEKIVDRCSSLPDICGKHGRCVNTDDGQFQCECDFLFDGMRCRSMSREGSQVILAAILVLSACLIPIVFRSIYRILKKKLDRTSPLYGQLHCLNNSNEKKKVIIHNENLIKFLFNISYSKFCNSSIFILLLSTFLLTSFCLFTISFIQYRLSISSLANLTNQTLTERLNSTMSRLQQCRKFDKNIWQTLVALPLAILITLICFGLKVRQSIRSSIYRDQSWLLLIFDLFGKQQRHVIAAIYGILANEVSKIFEELFFQMNRKYVSDDEGIITDLLKRIGIVLVIGMRYLPLLFTVNIPHPISYILGLIYTFIDATYTLIYTSYCSKSSLIHFSRTLISSSNSMKMTESDIVYVVLRNLPHFTMLSFVFVKFIHLLIQQLNDHCCEKRTNQISFISSTLSLDLIKPDYQNKSEFAYTQGLLKTKSSSEMYFENILTRPFEKIYRWHRYYTFSLQILCAYTVVTISIYNFTCLFTFYGVHTIKSLLDRIHLLVFHLFRWDIDWGTTFVNDLYFCSILSVFIYFIQIFNGLKKIQQHMIAGYAGRYVDIPPRHNFSNNELMTKSSHFMGYSCGYTAWGFIIFYKISFLVCLLLRLWIRYDSRWFQHMLALCLPFVLVYLLKHILVSLLSEFVFLQSFGRTPSLNNRRMYFIFNYFNFFFDCFLGILSCFIRVSKAVCASLLFMGRLDYSFMGRNLERLDQGYATYVTFIHMEIIHGHPILVTFCDIVWHDIERKRRITRHSKKNKLIYDNIMHTKVRLARFKWHLFYTLIRNEYLKFLRKHALLAATNSRGIISSTTAAAVVLTANSSDEKQFNSEQQHSSILLYDRPIMRQAPIPPKRSGYRYNFDYEQTSDLRFIYQQLKTLTTNVAQLRNISNNNNRLVKEADDEDLEEIYLPPNGSIRKKPSQVTCTFSEDYPTSKFHNMTTIQRR